ncbi:MAG: hypothetical protein M4579_004882 [Chaenotheca gracillima]|nr:MAG: hypothetical protein M4579_004882 [Chaenotheca gracillima]
MVPRKKRMFEEDSDGNDCDAHGLINVGRRRSMAGKRNNGVAATPQQPAQTLTVDSTWLNRIVGDLDKLRQSAIESCQDVVKLRAQVALVEGNYAKQTTELETLRSLVAQKLAEKDTPVDYQDGTPKSQQRNDRSKDSARSPSPSMTGRHGTVGHDLDDDDDQGIRTAQDDENDDVMQIDPVDSSAGTLRAQERSQESETRPAKPPSSMSGLSSAAKALLAGRGAAPKAADKRISIPAHLAPARDGDSTRLSDAPDIEKPQASNARKPQVAKRSGDTVGRNRSMNSDRASKPPVQKISEPTPQVFEDSMPVATSITIPKVSGANDPAVERSSPFTKEQEIAIGNIREIIACLPRPKKLKIPEKPVHFPPDFLREVVGGNAQTFATVSEGMFGKQAFPCKEMIKINPQAHGYAPRTGYHGALNFVDGYPMIGQSGVDYPLFWRAGDDWEYGGVYRIARRVPIPIAVWQTWGNEFKMGIARGVQNKEWGRELLSGIGIDPSDEDVTVHTILDLFERTEEPLLRMKYTILQCVGYNRIHYDLLARELLSWRPDASEGEAEEVPPPPAPKRGEMKPTRGRGGSKIAKQSTRKTNGDSRASTRKRTAKSSPDPQAPMTPSGRRQNTKRSRLNEQHAPSDGEMSDSITVRHQSNTPGRKRHARDKPVDYRLMKPELDRVLFADDRDEEEDAGVEDGQEERRQDGFQRGFDEEDDVVI